MAPSTTAGKKVNKPARGCNDFLGMCPESTIELISEFLGDLIVLKAEDIERLCSMPILPPKIEIHPFKLANQTEELRRVLDVCLVSRPYSFTLKEVTLQISSLDRYSGGIAWLQVLVSFENLQLVQVNASCEWPGVFSKTTLGMDRVVDVLKIARCKNVGITTSCSKKPAFLKTLQEARKIPRLSNLQLSGNGERLAAEYEAELRQLHAWESLKTVHIKFFGLAGDSYKGLVDAVRSSTSITSVTGSDIKEHSDFLTQLAKQSTSLTSLELFSFEAGALGLHDVAMALRTNTNLKVVTARGWVNDLSGCLAMLQMLRYNTTLRFLNLRCTFTFNANMRYVDSILKELSEVMVMNKTLQNLNLSMHSYAVQVDELGFEDHFSTVFNEQSSISFQTRRVPELGAVNGFIRTSKKHPGTMQKMGVFLDVSEYYDC